MSVLRDVIVVEQPAYATALLSQFATIEESDDCVIAVEEDMIDVTAIQKLILANCRLKDEHMVGLSTVGSQLEDIFYLNTSFNRLTSVSFMTDLKGLTYLDLSHNKIKTIAPLKSICQQLKVLRINNNDISQLDALSHMCNLVELWCCCNSLPWYEFYNLQSLSSLQQIVLYNNPALEKDEFYSFLCGCCPRLMRIDHHELFPSNANGANGTGAASQSIRSPSNVGNKKLSVQMNFQPTLDFLLTPSGRVMRTQARALLLNNGQQTVGDQIQSPSGESISRRQPANVAGKNGAGPGGVRVSNSGYGNSSRTNAPGGNKRPFTEGEALTGKVVTFKALKNVQNKIAELSSQVLREGDGPSSGDESGGEDIYTENHYSPVMHKVKGKHLGKHGREDGGVSGVGSPNNMLPTRAADGGAMAGLAEVRQKLLFPEEGGVACVVDVNGDGYARWGKIDTLACSFQHRKLFSSYRTGAVAVVLDAGTQVGSVMDNKGNTVLMFSVPQSGEDAAPVARLMNPSNGVVKQVFTRGAPVAKKAAKPKPVSWSADGLTITFDPVSWELSVLVDNGRCVSRFSSAGGISIVKEHGDKSVARSKVSGKPTVSPRGPSPARAGNNNAGVGGGMYFPGGLSGGAAAAPSALASEQYAAALSPRDLDYVNNDDYLPAGAAANVHQGVSSVYSQLSDLDTMLSGMKINSGMKGNSKRKP